MHLLSTRDLFSDKATLATLTLDGKGGFFVVEDEDRGLDWDMPLDEILRRKVREETAIPATNDGPPYRVGIRYSPGHQREMLCLIDVPGFRYILLHTGNNEKHTAGCQVIGTTRDPATMTVGHSRNAMRWLEPRLMSRVRTHNDVTYGIVRVPGYALAV